MELNPDLDLVINVADLTTEFRQFPTTFYQYCKEKANAESRRDVAKAKLKEVRAQAYIRIKANPIVKHTEKSIESEIDIDPAVIDAQMKLIKAEHDATTITGAVESMRAKKDCLIQLGSDRRKEI